MVVGGGSVRKKEEDGEESQSARERKKERHLLWLQRQQSLSHSSTGDKGHQCHANKRLEAPLCTDVCVQQWNKKVIVGLCKRRDINTQYYRVHTDTHNGSRRTLVGTIYSKHRWQNGQITRSSSHAV